MTLEDFIDEFRRVRDDSASGQLWSDDEITTYANDAVKEACERALLIEDRLTDDCCLVSLEADTASYELHASVLKVKRVTIDGRPLRETSVEAEDQADGFWENRTGTPQRYMRDGDSSIRFVPTPIAAADVQLTVYRTPLVPMVSGNSPEIKDLYHLRLMPWIYRCALLKTDSETFDKEGSAINEGIFTASFGQRPDANVQRKRRDQRPPVVSMGSSW